MLEPAKPVLTDDAIRGMTAEQASRAGVSMRFRVPDGPDKNHDLLICSTKALEKHRGKAEIVATYTEVDGVCKARALTRDPEISIHTLIGLVRFREAAEQQGVPLHCVSVLPEDDESEA